MHLQPSNEPTPETIETLAGLHHEFVAIWDAVEKAKRRNRLVCAYKRAIGATNTVAGLTKLRGLMEAAGLGEAIFPRSLIRHLNAKIIDCTAIENKPATARARHARRLARRVEKEALRIEREHSLQSQQRQIQPA